MNRLIRILIILAIIVPITTLASADDGSVVQAVLFYSPSCGHCHKVIQEDLPRSTINTTPRKNGFLSASLRAKRPANFPPSRD